MMTSRNIGKNIIRGETVFSTIVTDDHLNERKGINN